MFDCCLFHDEMDLLEIRFHTLNDVVEKFVIVESTKTHSGKPKELIFPYNKQRFSKFLSKIIYIVHGGVPLDFPNFNPWMNENTQRDSILECFNYSIPKDGLLFISDVDEIVKPEKLIEASNLSLETHLPVSIQMTNCLYYMNMVSTTHPMYWGPYIYNPTISCSQCNGIESPTTLRWHVCDKNAKLNLPTVSDGGWHFSTIGGIDRIKLKLESYAHTREFGVKEVLDNLTNSIESGKIFHDVVYKFDGESPTYIKKTDISFLPLYVLNNIERFKKYISKEIWEPKIEQIRKIGYSGA